MPKGADVLVAALENEGVDRISDAWSGRAEPFDRGGLCTSRRHAHDHAYRAKSD